MNITGLVASVSMHMSWDAACLSSSDGEAMQDPLNADPLAIMVLRPLGVTRCDPLAMQALPEYLSSPSGWDSPST